MTSTGKHVKHAALKRPDLGNFGRNEMAILGAPCSVIRELADDIKEHLHDRWKVAYADADHKSPGDAMANMSGLDLIDKIDARQLLTPQDFNQFERRALLAGQDCVLINGNHFSGAAQIVILHPDKQDSLARKTDRLTDVQMVLKAEDHMEPYPFLEQYIAPETPTFNLRDRSSILSWFDTWIQRRIPSVYGLVLAGGKSTRMGYDKTVLDFHGVPQREHLLSLLNDTCGTVRLSCRGDQQPDIPDYARILPDTFSGLGPFGGILSAFRAHPDKAWLVMATDLPLADRGAIDQLLDQRDPSQIATAFHNPETGFPEPLITIWEPKAYPVMLSFLAQGYSCPRKVLINSDVKSVKPENPRWLMNVNSPEDLTKVRAILEEEKV